MKNIAILVLITLMSCTLAEVEPLATVEGKVIIAPLCGNIPAITTNDNPCGLSDADLDAIYANYSVILKSNAKVVAEKKLDHTGVFSFGVNAGEYVVDIQSKSTAIVQVEQGKIAKTVTVAEQQKAEVIINIETGIK